MRNTPKSYQNEKSPVRYLTISQEEADQRIDNFLITKLKGVPKSHLYRLIRKGEIRVNKKRIDPHYRLIGGDIVRLPPLSLEIVKELKPSQTLINLLKDRILYEDDYIMVLNKPSGIPVHAGSTVKMGVIEALKAAYKNLPHLELVHRLDTETSGCLIIAKKKRILRELHQLLRDGGIKKTYWALTKGSWKVKKKVINLSLLKEYRKDGRQIVRVNEKEGKEAITIFDTLKIYEQASLMQAALMTGRTHQIRVSALHERHPIAGDERYGDTEFNKTMRELGLKRLFLHAHSLSFKLSGSDKPIQVTSPLDPELKAFLQSLKEKETL